MKYALTILSLALIGFAFKGTGEYSNLKIGQKAPMTDYEMKEVNGKTVTLASAAGENGLLVIFSCNTCPFVVGNGEKSDGWEGRYNAIQARAAKMGVNTILVNSNEAKRDGDDSFEEMVAHAKAAKYTSMYAMDSNHKLADAFGAKTTPHIFLFDKTMALTYQGAIDDNVNRAKEVKVKYLENALAASTKGEKAEITETKPLGCSIKRMSAK